MSYFLIWLFSVIEQIESLFKGASVVMIIILAFIHFRWMFTTFKDYSYTPNYEAPDSSTNRWNAICVKWRKKLISWTIFAIIMVAFIPTKKDVAIIFIGGQVGSFVMGNEAIQALPGDMAKYLQLELGGAIEGAKVDLKEAKEATSAAFQSVKETASSIDLSEETNQLKKLVKSKAKKKADEYLK